MTPAETVPPKVKTTGPAWDEPPRGCRDPTRPPRPAVSSAMAAHSCLCSSDPSAIRPPRRVKGSSSVMIGWTEASSPVDRAPAWSRKDAITKATPSHQVFRWKRPTSNRREKLFSGGSSALAFLCNTLEPALEKAASTARA